MKKTSELWFGIATLTTAAAAFSQVAVADEVAAEPVVKAHNIGPYVGLGAGYNKPASQTFDFRGSSTTVTQPTVPQELPENANTGIAAVNKYKGEVFYNAVVGYKYSNGLRPEFELAYRRNKADTIGYPDAGPGPKSGPDGVSLTTTTGMFNLWYDLFSSWSIHPYLGGGAGFSRFLLNSQPTDRLSQGALAVNLPAGPLVCTYQSCSGARKSDDATFAYQAGAGVRWDVTDTVTVGVDYRYVKSGVGQFYAYKDQPQTHLDADYKTQSVMLSVNYYFLKPATPPPAAAPQPVAVVASPPTPPPACSDGKDNDGDGLVDYPADKGCQSAEDNDETDPCKPPEAGQKVSLAGCGVGDVIVLRGVNFEFDKDRLTVNAKTILDGVGDELKSHPDINVELGGHTDAKGSDEYNQKLSQRRADSVKRYLAGTGVSDARMTAVGYGESHPVADNDTDEGRELNRRVELKITAGGTSSAATESATPVPADAADQAAALPAAADASAPAAELPPTDLPVN